MRFGFDLDEVVVNLTAEFEKYLESTYGIEWPPICFVHYSFVKCVFHSDPEFNARISKDMIRVANDPDFQFEAEPFYDAREVLIKLKHAGHKIYFITSRPKKNQPHTFKWLRKHDIPFDNLTVLGNDDPKGAYGLKYDLDMYVDDLESHLESMLAYKKKWRKGLILLDKPWNSDSIDGSKFKRVMNWYELLRHVGVHNR
jgi:uncharacterized HAD superfamily protein